MAQSIAGLTPIITNNLNDTMINNIVIEPDAENVGIVVHIPHSSSDDLGEVLELAERINRRVVVLGVNAKTFTVNRDDVEDYRIKPIPTSVDALIIKHIDEYIAKMVEVDEMYFLTKGECKQGWHHSMHFLNGQVTATSFGININPQHHNREYRSKPSDDY